MSINLADEANSWLLDIRNALGCEDSATAFKALQSVAGGLSATLDPAATALLSSAMPEPIRMLFSETSQTQPAVSLIDAVKRDYAPEEVDVEAICRAVLFVIALRSPIPRLHEIEAGLPDNVRNLWPLLPKEQ